MKTKYLTLLALAVTLQMGVGVNEAHAELVVINPGQLTYTLQEVSPRTGKPDGGCTLEKVGNGYIAKAKDSSGSCNIEFINFKTQLTINGYKFNHSYSLIITNESLSFDFGPISEADFQNALDSIPLDQLIGNSSVIVEDATGSWVGVDWLQKVGIDDFYDVQHATVYTKDGSCYSKQLRLEVNPATQEIYTGQIVDIAAKCP